MNIPKQIMENLHNTCDSYIMVLERMLPTFNRSLSNDQVIPADKNLFRALKAEAENHLHNLTQVKQDLQSMDPDEKTMAIELCTKIFKQTLTFVSEFESRVKTTSLLS